MKTRIFTLYATILVMATVTTATGQPGRGESNGNHGKNSRSETSAATRNEVRGNQNIRRNSDAGDRVDFSKEMRVTDNKVENKSSENQGTRTENPGNNYRNGDPRGASNSGHSVNQKGRPDDNRSSADNRERYTPGPAGRENPKGYTDHKGYKDNPAPKHFGNDHKGWESRNYSRHEWERRNYNWNDHHWQFSNYYRKGYIPWYFRENVNYWYYPEYGHILRGFRTEPLVLYSGMTRIYYSDGFFYRYHPGIGYVWIEEPWEIWFSEIPYHMVSVRIHGKNYFRLGNAYFLTGRRGFRLALLPERYYDPRFDRGLHFEISARF